MNADQRVQVVLELLEGKSSAGELAERHQVDEAELLAWRDTWLAGARASTRPRVPKRRLWLLGGVMATVLVVLASREALAASCAAPAAFSNLGLNYFCPNDPALASEFNANTAQLVGLIQQKLGAGWGAADAGASTTGITTTSATVSGGSTLTGGATVGPSASVSFGNQTRQMLNLWGTEYGVGVQDSTLYFRSGGNFAWYVGGTHSNSAFNSGGGVEAMRLTADGALSVRGLKQINNSSPVVAPAELQRLIVEANQDTVGTAVPINHAALTAMCRDDDGCQFTLGMVNWNGDGSATTRSGHLYLSQTTNTWRTELYGYADTEGVDSNGATTEISAWDCYFGDFNFAADSNNARQDTGLGFGLLNCRGCVYSDTATTCRMVFRD